MNQPVNQLLDDTKTTFLAPFEAWAEQISEIETKDALTLIRQKALEDIATQHFPTVKDEEWKYTDVKPILKTSFEVNTPTQLDAIPNPLTTIEAHVLVFVNGHFSEQLSSIQNQSDKIVIKPLSKTIRDDAQYVAEHFALESEKEVVSLFTHLNTAFTNDGIVVDIAPNQELKLPILAYFISDVRTQNTTSHVRNLIVLRENSRATFIENYIAIGEHTDLTNALSKIKVERYANLQHIKLQADERTNYHIGSTHVCQDDDSVYTNSTISLEGKLVRNDLRITLGKHCQTFMNGLYLLDGNTHVDNHTVVDHRKPNSKSDELYKGVLAGKSKGVFNGKIFVRQEAQKTNAFQSNKTILLSDEATIDTKPQLEIWADDVKCTHGATTGKLDEEAMFYLQSRGIPKQKAQGLLLEAFAKEVLDRIGIDALKDYLSKKIATKFKF